MNLPIKEKPNVHLKLSMLLINHKKLCLVMIGERANIARQEILVKEKNKTRGQNK